MGFSPARPDKGLACFFPVIRMDIRLWCMQTYVLAGRKEGLREAFHLFGMRLSFLFLPCDQFPSPEYISMDFGFEATHVERLNSSSPQRHAVSARQVHFSAQPATGALTSLNIFGDELGALNAFVMSSSLAWRLTDFRCERVSCEGKTIISRLGTS